VKGIHSIKKKTKTMTILTFNTKEHTLKITSEFPEISGSYTDISTIALPPTSHYYEVYQEDNMARKVPIFRFPTKDTIIKFIHS
jgi:hypothetical protein